MISSRLPDHTKLSHGAAQLRVAGDMLSARANHINTFADSIGPGFWVDNASTQTRSVLHGLAEELAIGRSALHEAATALDNAARLVGTKKLRHAQIEARLLELKRAPAPNSAAEVAQLVHERDAIERSVRATMSHARDAVDQSARKATRQQNKIRDAVGGVLGALGKGAAWFGQTVVEYFQGVGRVFKGMWDGTWALGEGVVSLAVFVGKFSAVRRLLDPEGYERDRAAFDAGFQAFVEALTQDPVGVAREIGKGIIDYDDMVNDPAHWAGSLIPGIAATVLSGGSGAVLKGSQAVNRASKVGDAATDAHRLGQVAAGGARGIVPPTKSLSQVLDEGADVGRWEGKAPIEGSESAHTLRKHVNLTDESNREYLMAKTRYKEGVFDSPAEANATVEAFLKQNTPAIEQWLKDGVDLQFQVDRIDLGREIGLTMRQAGGVQDIQPASSAVVILRRSNEVPEGFIVYTAYPRYPK